MSARLSVNINDETADALMELSQHKGIFVTEAVRRAVSVYDYLTTETTDNGQVLEVIDPRSGQVDRFKVL